MQMVRLMNGRTRYDGHVEILHDGEWRIVSGHAWDIYGAFVVCRSLGSSLVDLDTRPAEFVSKTARGNSFLDLNCNGDEIYISACNRTDRNAHDVKDMAYVKCGKEK